jgi:hypothetical protein
MKGRQAMLGRKTFTRKEVDHSKAAVGQQLAAYKKLRKVVASATSDNSVNAAFEDFEALFFNNMALALDRYFVHRLRIVTGKDGNPLNEVEMVADSLMNHDGVLRDSNVIKFIPDESIVTLTLATRFGSAQKSSNVFQQHSSPTSSASLLANMAQHVKMWLVAGR